MEGTHLRTLRKGRRQFGQRPMPGVEHRLPRERGEAIQFFDRLFTIKSAETADNRGYSKKLLADGVAEKAPVIRLLCGCSSVRLAMLDSSIVPLWLREPDFRSLFGA
jgi:hypothetical protein